MTFIPNPRLAEQLRAQPEYREALRQTVEPARAEADRIARAAGAPWLPRRGAPDLIVVADTPEGVRIVNTDHGAHWQEFGSRNNPPHAPLRRGARAAGLSITEQ